MWHVGNVKERSPFPHCLSEYLVQYSIDYIAVTEKLVLRDDNQSCYV